MYAWILLIIAGLLEVGWAIGLKYSDGFTRPLASTLTLIALSASFYLLSVALKTLPVGTGYAIWTGIGAAGTAVLGMILFDEPRNAGRLACLVLIVAGIVGLKYFSPPAG
ncbi:MAG: quaternary ammonium compound efflux SMR transporter SugE [Verrucomicrobia bacterium]|nr:quaternary ammonium compound efflux SMR transporter SugE [Verrucomicrobiota bacterium]